MNTSTDTCPSLEDLAAFLDGKLSGGERARVVAHLADCPRCYEVFAETARFQLYEEEEEDDPPIPFPLKKILPRVAAAMAALLAGCVVAIALYRQYNTVPGLTTAKLVSPAVAVKVADVEGFGDTPRGGPEDGGAFSSPSEFLLGAYVLDLRLSLQRNDPARAIDDLASINGQMEQFGFLPAQANRYKAIQAQIYGGKQPRDFVREAALLESELDANLYPEDISYGRWVPEALVRAVKLVPGQKASYGPSYFAFGKWAEAGRLSAIAKSPDFFQAPENRKFLRVFLRQQREYLDTEPEVAKALESIQKTLKESGPSSLPYKDLQGLFEKILTYYQNQSKQSEPG
jgi:hypothetical protein